MHLCQILSDRFSEIDAHYYARDILRQPPARMIGWVYAWCVERVASDKLEEWIAGLEEPLEWQDQNSESVIQLESDSFMKMMAKG